MPTSPPGPSRSAIRIRSWCLREEWKPARRPRPQADNPLRQACRLGLVAAAVGVQPNALHRALVALPATACAGALVDRTAVAEIAEEALTHGDTPSTAGPGPRRCGQGSTVRPLPPGASGIPSDSRTAARCRTSLRPCRYARGAAAQK